MKSKKHITPAEAAKQLGISERTLANYRTEGRGPKWKKVDGKVMYENVAVKEYPSRQKRQSMWDRHEPVVLNWKAPAKTQHHDV